MVELTDHGYDEPLEQNNMDTLFSPADNKLAEPKIGRIIRGTSQEEDTTLIKKLGHNIVCRDSLLHLCADCSASSATRNSLRT